MSRAEKKNHDFTKVAESSQKKTRTYLVTGATGFFGGHMARFLLNKKLNVRALGRNLKAGMELAKLGADFLPVDLRDRDAVIKACEDADIVIHAGALSSAWGKYKDFFDINVTGTQNVIDGCKAGGAKRLIYISSPSVMSIHGPQLDLDESHPLPDEHVSDYSETKALGEMRVSQAQQDGLKTVIIRPKAIYGPGDTAIFPRIIEAVSKGRLPIFGDGKVKTNITHVSDLVDAVWLATRAAKAVGQTYLITSGEEVELYELIGTVAKKLGYAPPKKKIPVEKAMKIGKALEDVWRALHLGGEPVLNRYKVSIMCFSQTYDIAKAREELGYNPKVKWPEGIEDFLEKLEVGKKKPVQQTADEPTTGTKTPVPLSIFSAGSTSAPERFFGSGDGMNKKEIPAMFAMIRHPEKGVVLFDTGYNTQWDKATDQLPYSMYRLLTPVKIKPEQNAGAQLSARDIDPASVNWIVLSHFDPDHIGGLVDFPNARFICHHRAWAAVRGKTGLSAMRVRFLPALAPPDIAARMIVLPDPDGPPIGPFQNSLDLFGDGSMRLVSIPGHAAGQLGAFVTDTDGKTFFLAADGVWCHKQIESAGESFSTHKWFAADKALQVGTYKTLFQLKQQMPDVEIVPAHCPEAALRFVESGGNSDKGVKR